MKVYKRLDVLLVLGKIIERIEEHPYIEPWFEQAYIERIYGDEIEFVKADAKEEEKALVNLAQLLLSKYASAELITLSPEEIEKVLINREKQIIYSGVMETLQDLEADVAGVCFDNLIIHGQRFHKLKNVIINLDKVVNKDLVATTFYRAKFIGSFDNTKLLHAKFSDCSAQHALDPQKVSKKALKYTALGGICINGSFDGVALNHIDFSGAKGIIRINPQKIQNKEIKNVVFEKCHCELVGDKIPETGKYEEASFKDCVIKDTSFGGVKNSVTINLDEIKDVYDNLSDCDITGIKIIGSVDEESEVLYGSSYRNSDNIRKHIWLNYPHTYESNPNIQINVIKRPLEEEKPKVNQKKSIFSILNKKNKK